MKTPKPILSQHRLQRLHRWAMLWLAWFAAFLEEAALFAPLSGQARALGHAWLDRIERTIVTLAMLQAVKRVRRGNAPKHSVTRRKESAFARAVLGCALRRRLRPSSLHARIQALRIDIGALAAAIVKRLPRGLTRRRPICAAPGDAHARLAVSESCSLLVVRVCHLICDTS